MKTIKYYIHFVIFFMILSCSSEKNNWEKIRNSSSINSFEDFIKKYPSGIYSDSANLAIERIYFEEAIKLDSISIYYAFKNKFLNSILIDSINKLIDKKEIMTAVGKKSIDELKKYINTNPNNKYILDAKLELEKLEYIEESKIANKFEVSNFSIYIEVKVVKGNLTLINGETVKKGFTIPVPEDLISFKEGKTLLIVVDGGVVFKGKKYSKGTKLIINTEGVIEDVR